MPVTYNLNNLADIQSLLDDKDFMGYMRDYFAANMPLPVPEQPMSNFMDIKGLSRGFGNIYGSYSYAAFPAGFVRDAIEAYQKWTGGAKAFDYTGNGVYDSTRRYGQAGWVATSLMQAMIIAGTTNRGQDWDKVQIARYVLFAATEAAFLAKNIWYVSSQRGIKANWDVRIEGMKALGLDATSLQSSKSLANARLDLKNAGLTSAGLALFTVFGALGIARNLATDFGNEKDPVYRTAAELALASSFMVTGGNALASLANGLTVVEKQLLIRELMAGLSTPMMGGTSGAAKTAFMTSARLGNVTAAMGLASSFLMAASIIVSLAAQAHVLANAGSRMTDSQRAAAGVEIGMQSLAAAIVISITVIQAAGLLSTSGPPGWVGAAILAVGVALLFSPVQIEAGVSMLRFADRLDRISDGYKAYGFDGYKYLGESMRTQGWLTLSGPMAILAFGGTGVLWAIFGPLFHQLILEDRADAMRGSILSEHGSFEKFWDQSYLAEARKIFASQNFLSSISDMASGLSTDGSERLLVLLGLSSNELQSNLAAIIREGASLPSAVFFAYSLRKKAGVNEGVMIRSILDKNTGTVDLSTDLIKQHVSFYGPLISASDTGMRIRENTGKDSYSTRIVYEPRQWSFVDGDTSTTVSLRGLSLNNLNNNDNLPARMSMGGGNDVIFAGARHFQVDGGTGINGVDYTEAFVADTGGKGGGGSSMTLQQAADGSFTVRRSGVGMMAYEEIKTRTERYGKRTETIEWIETGFKQVNYTATDHLTNIQWIKGSVGNDTFFGGNQDNFFVASVGADRYDGGGGTDWVDYSQFNAESRMHNTGIRLGLDTQGLQQAMGWTAAQLAAQFPVWMPDQGAVYFFHDSGVGRTTLFTNLLVNIENIRGTSKADVLIGNAKANVLMGGAGNDTIDGGAGNDVIGTGSGRDIVLGGDGNDMIYAEHAGTQLRGRYVMIRKNAGVAQHLTLAELQVMRGGENIARGKTLATSGQFDASQHKAGNLVDGNTGGDMWKDGIFASSMVGGGWIQVDLGASTGIDAINVFGRTDAWAGMNGDFTVYVSDVDMSAMTTTQIEGSTGVFMSRQDGQVGRVSLTPATFAYENQKTIHGSRGVDTLDYRYTATSFSVGINASLLSGTATTWSADPASWTIKDTLSNIDNLGGTDAGDRLVGDGQDNALNGYAGNDLLDGQSGNDVIVTGLGRDSVLGGAGDDTVLVQRRAPAMQGRYVMIRKNAGVAQALALADLQVMRGGVNIVQGASVVSSRTGDQTNHKSAKQVVYQGQGYSNSPIGGGWVLVDLGASTGIDAINVFGRTDAWAGMNGDFTVYVSDQDMSAMSTTQIEAMSGVFSSRHDGWSSQVTIDAKAILAADQKTIDGGEGTDTVDYSSFEGIQGAGIEADLSKTDNQTVKTWRNANGTINAGSAIDSLQNVENLGGTGGNDKIVGSDVDNRLWGYGGDDMIEGRGGNDTIFTGLGRDSVLGGAGDDSVVVQRRAPAMQGRYVMIRKNAGVAQHLTLAELQVMRGGENIARGKTLATSGQFDASQHKAGNLVDGNTGGDMWKDGIFASSMVGGGWVQVDLGASTGIDAINVFGRTDAWAGMNGDFTVYVSDVDMSAMSTTQIEAMSGVFSSRHDGWSSQVTIDAKAILAADQKTIDGGEGTDTVDYSSFEGIQGAGIEADLSKTDNQTVMTWRNANGTINAASAIDRLQNVENLGGTGGNDKIVGSDVDNRLWGYGGDDMIEGRGGNDTIVTGLGRDSVLGGAGDDTVLVTHERQKLLWSAAATLGAAPVTLAAMGRVFDADLTDSANTITVDGAFFGGERQAQITSVDRSQTGQVTFWAQYWDGSATKAVKVLLGDTTSGGVQASVLGAALVARNVTAQNFDWNAEVVSVALSHETFDAGSTPTGWVSTAQWGSVSQVTTLAAPMNGFLGRFSDGTGKQVVSKAYDFGKAYANTEVTVSFDMYEIDSWDGESFKVFINGSEVSSKSLHFGRLDGGSKIGNPSNASTGGWGYDPDFDELHRYKFQAVTDANGRLTLGFGSTLDQLASDEAWGIDNVAISRPGVAPVALSHETFDAGSTPTGWVSTAQWGSVSQVTTLAAPMNGFLGRFSDGTGKQVVSKAYDFGKAYANTEVTVSFDMYEIDSWDGESFKVFINGSEVSSKSLHFGRLDGGSKIGNPSNASTGGWGYDPDFDELHRYKFQAVTDANGRLTLGFGSTLDQLASDEAWGIDNVVISRPGVIDSSVWLGADGHVASLASYTVKKMTLVGLGAWTDQKTIDGGEGTDKVDYQQMAVFRGAGIEADLSITNKQTVKTWRNTDGTINAASATDSLNGIENLGATEGNDKIVGSEVDNRLWGYGGDDDIDGRGGNDNIFTGTGRDTVRGGAGDDVVQVEHAADGDFFSDDTPLSSSARNVLATSTLDQVNFLTSAFVLSGAGIPSGQAGKILQDEGSAQGVGTRTLWIGYYDGTQTRAVRVQFADATDVNVSARVLASKSTVGDVTASAFDWNQQGTSAGAVYTLASMKLWKALTKFTDAKEIDAGDGKDTVSYSALAVLGDAGIEADLSNAVSQTVKTWRNADGTINAASVTDKLANIESLVGTTGNDKIIGSAADNRLWGNGGNDQIDGQAGNDVISTGTGRDTVLGGAGDDTIAIAHERQNQTWTSAGYVAGSASSLAAVGRVAEINLVDRATAVTLNGASLGRDQLAEIARIDRTVQGRLTFWAQFWDGSVTRAVQVEVRDTPTGGVEALVLGAAYVQKNVTGQDFDWGSAMAIKTTVATGDAMAGQGVKRLALAGLGAWGDAKTVQGGEGVDTADYQQMEVVDGAGIEADLSNTASQTVKTWRQIDGSLREASVIDSLKDMENLVGTSGDDKIVGSAAANRLWAGDGDDWVESGDGADMISTGAGRDTIMGGSGNDAIFVEQEAATLKGRYLLIRHTPGVARALSLSELKVWSGGKNVASSAKVILSADGAASGSPGAKLIDGVEGTLLTDAYLSQATDGSSWVMIDLGQAFAIDRIDLSTLATSMHGPLGGNLAVVVGGLDLQGDASNYARLTARSDVRYAELGGQQFSGVSGLLSADGRLSLGVERFVRSKTLDGGADEDFVSYRATEGSKGVGIHASLATSQVHTWYENGVTKDGGAIDVLKGIENVGGTEVDDWLEGDAGANKLVGYGGNDRLRGGAGNDQLAGGYGSDKYEFSGDWGTDILYEEDKGDTITDTDRVVFDADTGYEKLWFSKQGNSLVVSSIGSSNHVVMADWYADSSFKGKVERFESGGYEIVGVQKINAFVSALATFSASAPSSIGQMNQQGVYNQMAQYWLAKPL
ncbi:hypothetical protein B9Z45_15705 [Limnohabitans sp. 2KL-17]|uniref:galactose-binding domain-containing protein n=1 Tax=Limnohabitans sp. 2KL-17 TaxID=1100704 RepID=UPI000D3C6A21|nr:hypothetical protein [Limnohabitans sp. 2KL-17]PUE49516.1 hypothetical protein B9Z45_15705 [Limnohabitans sp. 2KL-17]